MSIPTQQKTESKNVIGSEVFVIDSSKRTCGPDSETLQLCLRGRGQVKNIIIPLGNQMALYGEVTCMERLKYHEMPGRDTSLEWYRLSLDEVCFQHHPLQRAGIREIRDFIYCAGPSAKDRWCFFTPTRSRGERCKALIKLEDQLRLALGKMCLGEYENVPFRDYSKICVLPVLASIPINIWITESKESMNDDGLEPLEAPNQFCPSDLLGALHGNWRGLAHFAIRLDLNTWTLSHWMPSWPKGEGTLQHIRLKNTVEDIVNQVNRVFYGLWTAHRVIRGHINHPEIEGIARKHLDAIGKSTMPADN